MRPNRCDTIVELIDTMLAEWEVHPDTSPPDPALPLPRQPSQPTERPIDHVPKPAQPGPVTLDQVCAHEIAERFCQAPSTPDNPVVKAAYRLLEHQSNRLFVLLTSGSPGLYIRVVFTNCPVPYCSDEEMIFGVRVTRLLEVTTSASESDRFHPLLGGEPGGAYDRFRAVHDIVGHIDTGFGFDRFGEFAAWLAQDRFYRGLARLALGTELHGEHSVRWTTGQVADHKATLLDPRILARARTGVPQQLDDVLRCTAGCQAAAPKRERTSPPTGPGNGAPPLATSAPWNREPGSPPQGPAPGAYQVRWAGTQIALD